MRHDSDEPITILEDEKEREVLKDRKEEKELPYAAVRAPINQSRPEDIEANREQKGNEKTEVGITVKD